LKEYVEVTSSNQLNDSDFTYFSESSSKVPNTDSVHQKKRPMSKQPSLRLSKPNKEANLSKTGKSKFSSQLLEEEDSENENFEMPSSNFEQKDNLLSKKINKGALKVSYSMKEEEK